MLLAQYAYEITALFFVLVQQTLALSAWWWYLCKVRSVRRLLYQTEFDVSWRPAHARLRNRRWWRHGPRGRHCRSSDTRVDFRWRNERALTTARARTVAAGVLASSAAAFCAVAACACAQPIKYQSFCDVLRSVSKTTSTHYCCISCLHRRCICHLELTVCKYSICGPTLSLVVNADSNPNCSKPHLLTQLGTVQRYHSNPNRVYQRPIALYKLFSSSSSCSSSGSGSSGFGGSSSSGGGGSGGGGWCWQFIQWEK